jgi:hypothetical protein
MLWIYVTTIYLLFSINKAAMRQVHKYVRNFWQKRPPASVKCQKRPPPKIFAKKDPLWVAAPLPQATRGTCRHPQCRHHLAAVAKPGTWPWRLAGIDVAGMPPRPLPAPLATWTCRHSHRRQGLATWTCRHPHWRQAPQRLMALAGNDATATCRHPHWRQALAAIGPGGTCHVSPGAGVPPLTGGLFWQIFSEVVSFDISLVQVVSSVKNSYVRASHYFLFTPLGNKESTHSPSRIFGSPSFFLLWAPALDGRLAAAGGIPSSPHNLPRFEAPWHEPRALPPKSTLHGPSLQGS